MSMFFERKKAKSVSDHFVCLQKLKPLVSYNISSWKGPIRIIKSNSLFLAGLPKNKLMKHRSKQQKKSTYAHKPCTLKINDRVRLSVEHPTLGPRLITVPVN